jgi:hypothetical protein
MLRRELGDRKEEGETERITATVLIRQDGQMAMDQPIPFGQWAQNTARKFH